MNQRLLVALAAALCGGAGWHQLQRLDGRLASLEEAPRIGPGEIEGLGERLERIQGELLASSRLLGEVRDGGAGAAEAGHRLQLIEAGLREQLEALRSLREREVREMAESIGAGLARLDAAVEKHWRRLESDVQAAAHLARENRGSLEELRGGKLLDREARWRSLMGPTVQLAGSGTVGSGVLLPSQPDGDSGYHTLVLTAWHVVRDILPDLQASGGAVPVRIYQPGGRYEEERATLVDYDPRIDVALLRLDSHRRFDFGARLAPRSRLERVHTFDPVYAVGCPLGNDPIPTAGEVAETRHVVDGETYWMINAPTYIGNSGGGIFDAETHQLIALFTKIYTHGSLRPTVVPHMGLAVPLQHVYDWLDSLGIALPDPTSSSHPSLASAQLDVRAAEAE